MGTLQIWLGVLLLLGIGIIFGSHDRRPSPPPMRTEQAVRLVRTTKGTQLLNELSSHRDRGGLARVALGTGGSAEYASGQYTTAVAIEPVFLASGAATPVIPVDPAGTSPLDLMRGGLAGDTTRGSDETMALGDVSGYDRIVLNVEEAPVAVADATGRGDSGGRATTLASAEAEYAAPTTPWLPPLAAGH